MNKKLGLRFILDKNQVLHMSVRLKRSRGNRITNETIFRSFFGYAFIRIRDAGDVSEAPEAPGNR